ncbi:hypothetical protein [Marinomonas aquiplantarum]|uniref:Uncharacterized protein n=1 Tax=Marinomonas aquiplantarum TaxID=491951 RepID=A0A366CVJ3_9GAMM|nr:hypothetical protein [Marinomonas aquiplantarum]RBO81861.1 hypothetical protein DFP76_1074 [Marinomonas aquiplantarum]
MQIAGFEIENRRGFLSALFGLLASIVMAMGSDGLLGSISNLTSDWGDVKSAVHTLHSYDVNKVGGRAALKPSDEGFNEFQGVIANKVPWLKYNKPDYFLMNTPATIGGAPRKVVHAVFNNQAKAIGDFYIIDGWLVQEKQKDYLYKGLFLLFISFCIAVSQYIKPAY